MNQKVCFEDARRKVALDVKRDGRSYSNFYTTRDFARFECKETLFEKHINRAKKIGLDHKLILDSSRMQRLFTPSDTSKLL